MNVPYRPDFREGGYDGGHVSATAKTFVQYYLAPAMMDSDRRLVGGSRTTPYTPPDYARSTPKPDRVTARTKAPSAETVDDPIRRADPSIDDGYAVEGYPEDAVPGADSAPVATEGSFDDSSLFEPGYSPPPPGEPNRLADTVDARGGVEGDEDSAEAVGG